MSIRPTYRKRSVLQVLADGMSAHPPRPEAHINVTADAASTPADFSEKLRKLSEEFRKNAQMRALRDAEGNVVEHVLTPRKFAAGGYVPSPEGGGESCCEEAQLTASELARRNEELSEAQGEIAALKDQVCDWKSGADAEAWAHDEARDEITGLVNEIARIQGESKAEIKALARRAEKAEAERDEAIERAEYWGEQAGESDALATDLQAKLDDAENHVVVGGKLPAWAKPTLNRMQVEQVLDFYFGHSSDEVKREAADKLLALAPAAENRPTLNREAVERLIRLELKSVVSDVRGTAEKIVALVPARNVTRDDLPRPEDVDGWGYRATDPRYPSRLLDAVVEHLNERGGIPSKRGNACFEEAVTGDEDQHVEEWARKAAHIMAQSACDELGQPYEVIDILIERLMPRCRDLVDAGWTPPESEATA